MSENNTEIVRRYIEDVIAAETAFETQYRSFATVGDDAEVQSLFAEHAGQTASQIARLNARLAALGGAPSTAKSWLAHIFSFAPSVAKLTHLKEERLTQNLIAAYSVEMSECAMYQALETVARAAGDTITAELAAEIAAQELATAEKVWRFLPSRSKIAFNVLTAGEVDPSVETRAPDDRLVQ